MEHKHGHYFVNVAGLDWVDFYRLAELYRITCPSAQHVFKKSMAMGVRGAKDLRRDWEDVLDTAQRKLAMLNEDEARAGKVETIAAVDLSLLNRAMAARDAIVSGFGPVPSNGIDDESPRALAVGQNGNDGVGSLRVGDPCPDCGARHGVGMHLANCSLFGYTSIEARLVQ